MFDVLQRRRETHDRLHVPSSAVFKSMEGSQLLATGWRRSAEQLSDRARSLGDRGPDGGLPVCSAVPFSAGGTGHVTRI